MDAVAFRCIPLQLDANAVIGMPFRPSFNERDPLLWEQDVSHSKRSQNIKQYTGLPSSCRCVELVCGLPCGLPDRLRRIATVRDGLNRASAFNFRSSVSLGPRGYGG
jgi:hypothetical protein